MFVVVVAVVVVFALVVSVVLLVAVAVPVMILLTDSTVRVASSRTELSEDIVDVTSFSSLDVVEITESHHRRQP